MLKKEIEVLTRMVMIKIIQLPKVSQSEIIYKYLENNNEIFTF